MYSKQKLNSLQFVTQILLSQVYNIPKGSNGLPGSIRMRNLWPEQFSISSTLGLTSPDADRSTSPF